MKKQKATLIFSWCIASLFCTQVATPSCEEEWFSGEGTQYGGIAGTDGGNCGIFVEEDDFYHCAMNHAQYDSSSACGGCVQIIGPIGEITVQVVDRCPECKFGDIDLSTGAFEMIAKLEDGRVPIRWKYVPCDGGDDIKIRFAAGTSQFYFKGIFYNTRHRIAKVEYRKEDGTFHPIHREMYNYFVAPSGIDEDKSKTGPYTFRLTDTEGQEVLIENVAYEADIEISTNVQFPALVCGETDCAGVVDGKAEIDHCGICAGGTTGIVPDSSCQQDCHGDWGGLAYLDKCGNCVGGETGETPCDDTGLDDAGLQEGDQIEAIFDMTGRKVSDGVSFDELVHFRRSHAGIYILSLNRKGETKKVRLIGKTND